ncbi:MAG: metallophosphoesterase, partial [Planctomycetota bacterium]
LSADTLYYYRLRFRATSESPWTPGDEYSFHTQRPPNSTFTFTITSDSHVNILMGIPSVWTQTLNNVAADNPEFHIDLGDTVAMRSVSPGDVAGAEAAYEYQRPFFDIISRSAPIFLAPGNHEQQEGWHLLSPLETSLPVIGTNAEKKYFLNPVPDAFYSGDANTYSYLDGDHLREDYYSWTWGDALFVVIDPYWFSTTRPYVTDPGGGETDTTGSGDCWDWTLGQEQYNWLKTTLETSNTRYKFIFSHQMTADASLFGQEDYGHGGANHSHFTEWGGYNEDGTTWGWDTERPGWGSQPIHQMMVANGVSAFFHGHDHQYAYEKRDGVVYQSIPAGGWGDGQNGFNMYTTGDGYTIQALPNAGHLRITVEPSQATVDYVANSTGTVNYSYTIEAEPIPELVISGYILDVNGIPVEGVDVDANNNGTYDITDVNGYYEVEVPNDWSGTVTPTKPDYTFDPTSSSYTNVTTDIADQNYTGTYTPDTTPPEPDPMTWATVPAMTERWSIAMIATTATDDSLPVEYYFECTNYGDANSNWQTDTTYVATDLAPSTQYTFRVKARDSAAAQNETAWSSSASVVVLLDDGFEGTVWDANWVSPHNWLEDTGTYASGTASAHADTSNCGDFICLGLDVGDATAIHVDFWFMKSNTGVGNFELYYYDGTSYNLITDLDALGSDDIWLHYTDVITDSNYFIPDFQIRFNAALSGVGPPKDVWVDDVLITKGTVEVTPCDLANLDGVGIVNFKDFAILADDWWLTGLGLAGDITGDEFVNFEDLAEIAQYWLDDCNQP